MNEAINSLAASNTTETLTPVHILNTVETLEDKVESEVKTEVGSAESKAKTFETEVAALEAEFKVIEAEIKKELAAKEAVAEAKKIEEAATKVVTEVKDKVRNVFQETESFVEKEAKKVWVLPHNSIIRNPA